MTDVAQAIGCLIWAAAGFTLFHFAEAIATANRRLNEALARRLPRSLSILAPHGEASHGAMYLFCALGGMMMGVLGLIGFVLSI